DRGFTIDSVPGGYAPMFQLSFDIKVTAGANISTKRVKGTTLKLQMVYNSYGQDRRVVPVDCIWQTDEIEDPISHAKYRQRTTWNWHKATVELLLHTLSDAGEAKDVCKKIGLVAASRTKCYCPALGVPKTAPVSYSDMGARIKKSRETMDLLRMTFGIKQCKVFRPAVDFMEQKKALNMSHVDDLYNLSGEEDETSED
ncbi:MAG TPA: hypothetical protein VMY18_03355, partial [Acidobacteriota bacterium]|nr:hypothetical protein [Acidobacteriota bacterium]